PPCLEGCLLMADQNFVATFTVAAVPRDGGGQPQVQKVKLSGGSSAPGPSAPGPSGPQTPPRTLLEKCAASLCLPDGTPNPGCEAGQAQHDRWIRWLANAFPYPGVFAKDIAGAANCLTVQRCTTCSHVLNVAFRHFGIPAKYYNGSGPSIVP